MKKRFILLPLLLFVLAGCDPVVDPTDTGTDTTTDTGTDTGSTTDTDTDTTPEVDEVDVPSVSLLATHAVGDDVDLVDAEVILNLHQHKVMVLATKEGTVLVNYFTSPGYVAEDLEDVVAGDHLNVEGAIATSTGGDYARAKTLVPEDIEIVEESDWVVKSLVATEATDMLDGFGAWADALNIDSFGKVYKWTNVQLIKMYDGSGTNETGYHVFNYDKSVDGKNTGTGGYYRLGFYHVDMDAFEWEEDGLYTIEGLLGGTNKDMPYAAGANPMIRVSHLGAITRTGTVEVDEPDEPDPIEAMTIAAFLAGANDVQGELEGIITSLAPFNSYSFEDATGAIAFRDYKNTLTTGLAVGDKIKAKVKKNNFGGLIQAELLSGEEPEKLSSGNPLPATVDLQSNALTSASLLPLQSHLVKLEGMVVKTNVIDSFKNRVLTVERDDKATIQVKWDFRIVIDGLADHLDALVEGDVLKIDGATLSWASNNPVLMIDAIAHVTKTGHVEPVEPEPSELQEVVTITVDSLGLGDKTYSSNHDGVDVDGLLLGWTEMGNYGDGLQWRHKDDNKSAIYNVEEAGAVLLSVEINYNGPKHGDVNVPPTLDLYVGNTASLKDATEGFETINTVAGTFKYTATFEAGDNVTFFKLQKTAAQYGIYLTSIVLTFDV